MLQTLLIKTFQVFFTLEAHPLFVFIPLLYDRKFLFVFTWLMIVSPRFHAHHAYSTKELKAQKKFYFRFFFYHIRRFEHFRVTVSCPRRCAPQIVDADVVRLLSLQYFIRFVTASFRPISFITKRAMLSIADFCYLIFPLRAEKDSKTRKRIRRFRGVSASCTFGEWRMKNEICRFGTRANAAGTAHRRCLLADSPAGFPRR